MTSKTKTFTIAALGVAALLAIGLCVGLTACGKDECAHESVEWDTVVSATCTADGYQSGICETCGETVTKVLPATGHSWDEGVITKDATEDEDGEITYTCEVCGATKVEAVEYAEPDEDLDEDENEDEGEDENLDEDDEDNEGSLDEDEDENEDEEGTFERVIAVETGDSRLGPFNTTEISVSYDEATKTYAVSGTSIPFGEDVSDFWGSAADSHADCEYIAFEINVGADETLKITSVDADGETVKVRAMYGENVTDKITDDEGAEIKEADGVWIIDVTKEDNHEGSFKMTIEVIGADGTVSETYYVVIGTITSSVAA